MTTHDVALFQSLPTIVYKPFVHFSVSSAFGKNIADEILAWLSAYGSWKLVQTDFYEQYEFSLFEADLPVRLSFLTQTTFLLQMRRWVERLFGVVLHAGVDCTAHKLISGQRIRIHNDFRPGGETHRLIIQFNRGWQVADGGYLMFFNSPNPEDVFALMPPAHDSLAGFAISQESHHAVSTVHGGERYTLVYSFYSE